METRKDSVPQTVSEIEAMKPAKREKALATAKNKLARIITDLKKSFVERDGVIESMVAAYLAGENILLLGPPGTAKSLLAERVCEALGGGEYFRYLMTRFTVPEELFGPYLPSEMMIGNFIRKTTGMLPEANVGFLDEIFKSNSSILSALLELANERTFSNGTDGRYKTPLRSIVGASNETPGDVELAALDDRFVVRYWIDYATTRRARKRIALADDIGRSASDALTEQEVVLLAEDAKGVDLPKDIIQVLMEIEDKLNKAGLVQSDRRRRTTWRYLRFAAYVRGESAVTEDVLIDELPATWWKEPKERAAIERVISSVANPTAALAEQILDEAKEMLSKLPDRENDPTAFAASLASVNTEIKKAARKILEFDPKRKSARIKKTAGEMSEVYKASATLVLQSADMGDFLGDKLSRELEEYKGGDDE